MVCLQGGEKASGWERASENAPRISAPPILKPNISFMLKFLQMICVSESMALRGWPVTLAVTFLGAVAFAHRVAEIKLLLWLGAV